MRARRHGGWVGFCFNALLIIAMPVLFGYIVYRWIRGKSREGWDERMGYLPVLRGQKTIWVHAVSAGEAVAAEAVVRALRARIPDAHILYTAGTPEGRATAIKRMGDLLDHVAYVPYDFPWAVARAMDRVRPCLFVLVESDLWPNLLQAAVDRGIPAMLANGYISERTLRRGRWVPFLYRWIFASLSAICVRSEAVKRRALALEAPPERIRVAGNVKYDQATTPLPPPQADAWRQLLHLSPDEPVLVAGSTHPGEEELVLEAYRKLREAGAPFRLILAPRHPQRAGDVEALVRNAGLPVVRRSRLGRLPAAPAGASGNEAGAPPTSQEGNAPVDEAPPGDTVILLDTMGELAGVFSLATVVFLGGSLVPIGGHDILQPLIAGKPVLVGPYTHRQREIVEEALADGVAWEVSNPDELASAARQLMAAMRNGSGYAERAVQFVVSRRGASERCAEEAARLLQEREGMACAGKVDTRGDR